MLQRMYPQMPDSPTGKSSILAVVGPHSGCGKSTFVLHLLREIGGMGCLKVSPAHDWSPEAAESAELVGEDFYLESAARLKRPGKDTALYLAAGALEVKRLRHRNEGLRPGLRAALELFPPSMPITLESSSALNWVSAKAIVLVIRPPMKEMKPSTAGLLSQVTDILINAPGAHTGHETLGQLSSEYPALAPEYAWQADLIAAPPPEAMLSRIRSLLWPRSPEENLG